MIIDKELVFVDNKAITDSATSDVVKMPVAYKPMFLYAHVNGTGNGSINIALEYSNTENMTSPTTVATLPLAVANGKGILKASLPLIEGQGFKPLYFRTKVSGAYNSGKVFICAVSDVDVH